MDLNNKTKILHIGLFNNRHNFPLEDIKDGFVFYESFKSDVITNVDKIDEMSSHILSKLIGDISNFDKVIIYLAVTGLTVALISVINYFLKLSRKKDVSLILKHYNRTTGEYYEQTICLKD